MALAESKVQAKWAESFFIFIKLIKRWCVSHVKGIDVIIGGVCFQEIKTRVCAVEKERNNDENLLHPERKWKVRLVTEFNWTPKRKKLRRPAKRKKKEKTFTFVDEDCPGVQQVNLFFLFPVAQWGGWLTVRHCPSTQPIGEPPVRACQSPSEGKPRRSFARLYPPGSFRRVAPVHSVHLFQKSNFLRCAQNVSSFKSGLKALLFATAYS